MHRGRKTAGEVSTYCSDMKSLETNYARRQNPNVEPNKLIRLFYFFQEHKFHLCINYRTKNKAYYYFIDRQSRKTFNGYVNFEHKIFSLKVFFTKNEDVILLEKGFGYIIHTFIPR